MDVTVKHSEEEQLFYAEINGEKAELAYELLQDHRIDFMHTYVPEVVRGEGVAEQLAKAGLDFAQANQYRVVPTCRFMKQYLQRHPQ